MHRCSSSETGLLGEEALGEQGPFRQWGEGAMLDQEPKGSQEKKT